MNVTSNDTLRQNMYDFLLEFHSNYQPFSYHFSNTARCSFFHPHISHLYWMSNWGWHFVTGSAMRKDNKSSAVAEMGDHGHNRHGPKRRGLLRPFCGELGPSLKPWFHVKIKLF